VPDIDAVYREYFTDVYKYLITLCRDQALAEELTQETFFKALRSLNSFKGDCSLYAWLCQIAKNLYFTHYRKQKRSLPAVTEETEDIESTFINADDARKLHKILHHLEEPYKEVFTLRTFGELPFAQIGELFGKSESWARVTYHRAKLKIREEYE